MSNRDASSSTYPPKKPQRLAIGTFFSIKQIHFPFVSGVPVEAAQPEDSVPFRSANGINARAEPDWLLTVSCKKLASE
ncbi:hypothetical protein HCN83_09740 [Bacillus luteus]|uniref:Uncharacterized protein n=1 Tax=Alkalicoccus luteus TaxID=1237094 RepID=A0A969TV93_9BACI|nr:hypothetical protein [Alkalicoccus luteus]